MIACAPTRAVILSAAVWFKNLGSPLSGSAWFDASPLYAWMTVSYAPLVA